MSLNTKESGLIESAATILEPARKSAAYWEELAILDFTEEVLRSMEESGVSKTALATRLDVEPAYVSKLIGGSNNFTLRTMVKIARALEANLRFHLQPVGTKAVWTDYNFVPIPMQFSGSALSPIPNIYQGNFKVFVTSPPSTVTYAARAPAA